MKKTQEILGLPIISISDGMEVGQVKGLIVNADKGAVDYIIVDSGLQIHGIRVIPSSKVLGIGEYALTIEDEQSISDISIIPEAVELIQKDIHVKNTRVMTKKGRLIGETRDIYVDEDELCRISGLEFIAVINPGQVRIIPRDNVITFGKKLIVVTEDVESALVDEIEKKNPVDSPPPMQPDNNIPEIIADQEENLLEEALPVLAQEEAAYVEEAGSLDTLVEASVADTIDVVVESNVETVDIIEAVVLESAVEQSEPENAPVVENTAANLFEQKQRQYLNGRKATKTITDNSGNVIINEGMVINDEIIDIAKANGKLIELVMNNKA